MTNFDRSISLPRTLALIEAGIEDREQLGAQLYVSRSGEVVADTGLGEARPGQPMRTDTMMLWMSATKPVTAAAIAVLWQRGLLVLDTPVTRYIHEFGQAEKNRITVRNLLTHTAGIRNSDVSIRGMSSTEAIVRRICGMRGEPSWIPGLKAGYHMSASWYILGEIVHRVDGRTVDRFIRQEVFEPLGMNDSWVGLNRTQHESYGSRIGYMYNTETGSPELLDYHSEHACGIPSPAANGRGPVRELGWFYESLLSRSKDSDCRSILLPQTTEAMTARHRCGMKDHTFQHVLDWGLGFQLSSNMYGKETVPYGFGRHCSDRTFGHGGRQSSVGFADPENDVVVALVLNGMPGEKRHSERIRDLLSAIYEDLGINSKQEKK